MKSDLHALRGLIRRVDNIVFGYRPRGKGRKIRKYKLTK